MAGDPTAWAAIYDDLAPAVLAFLRARGAFEPEDLLGEVMLQVARDLPRFAGGQAELRSWVFQIARNRMIDDARYRQRRPVTSLPPAELVAAAGTGDAERDVVDRLVDERILRLMRELPAAQRDVVILRFFSDLTIAEIAHVVGKREGAVKALQRRALARLRKRL